MKIALITCYDQNDYIRARGLRTAFAACPGVSVLLVRNSQKGLLRYIEVPLKILTARFFERPDAYVVTFRGYEMLLFLRLTGVRKPIIFDEMINFVEYFQEHDRVHPGTWRYRLLRRFYRWQIRGCRAVLADTKAHAVFSAQTSGVPRALFAVLPVAADETIFSPQTSALAAPAVAESGAPQNIFTVFYYGNGMTPLHGLQYVLDAAILLKDSKNIRFSIVGGKQKAADACAAAAAKGAHIAYETWVPFEEIPARVHAAGLCLGGPFGSTLQSQFVVTGKTAQFLACAAPVMVGKNKVSGMFLDGRNCLLVPPANAEAIAGAVRWASAHPKELRRIGMAGRQLYEAYFSQDVVNRQIKKLVGKLGRPRQ